MRYFIAIWIILYSATAKADDDQSAEYVMCLVKNSYTQNLANPQKDIDGDAQILYNSCQTEEKAYLAACKLDLNSCMASAAAMAFVAHNSSRYALAKQGWQPNP